MIRTVTTVCVLILLGVAGVSGCGNAAGPAQVLQAGCEPSNDEMKSGEFTSPSKAYRLERIPHNEIVYFRDLPIPRLQGARYRMTHEGKEIWAVERDYALQEPLVTDDGTVVGVAYRDEYEDGKPWHRVGKYLHIVIIRDGRDVQDWMGERHVPAGEPLLIAQPFAEALTVDCANDRIIVQAVESEYTWAGRYVIWVFRLSTGEFLSGIDLVEVLKSLGYRDSVESEGTIYLLGLWPGVSELQPVAGTPLLLVHCRRSNEAYARKGPRVEEDSLFLLVDTTGKLIWSLLLPRNTSYTIDSAARDHGMVRNPPHPLSITGKPGYFGVFRTREDCVETYAVKNRGANGWSVTKTGRTTLAKARREHGVESRPAP